MKSLQVLMLIAACVVSLNVYSYKEATHQDLSRYAVEISNLSQDQSLLTNLGLKDFSRNQKFTNPVDQSGNKLSITELVSNGAKFEDRSPRFLNHFYNPINEAPLTVVLPLGLRSPDWALEDGGDVTSVLAGSQEYSYKEAMNYFHLALTSQTEKLRELNWGELFQSLGHVIHHVQDMAQPDHVRNDQHNAVTDPSWYEAYTDDLIENRDATFNALMTGNTHPIPEFLTARDFWTTRTADPVIANRRGIADFTNRNFVSKDTIFLINNGTIRPSPAFPLPTPDITPTTVDIADPSIKGVLGQALCDQIKARSLFPFPNNACYIDFVSTPITGAIAGEPTTNTRAASYSIFDKKLQDHNVDPIYIREDGSIDTIDRSFTLNEFNFRAAHDYLIPRAVAFSAGLINHFFQKRFTVTIDEVNRKYHIKNISGEKIYGNFYLYGNYLNEIDNWQQVQSWVIPESGLEKHSEIVVDIPDLASYGLDMKIIYRGRVGADSLVDVVDARTVNVRFEISGFTTFDNHDFRIEKRHSNGFFYHNYNTYNFNYEHTFDYSGTTQFYSVNNYYWRYDSGNFLCLVEVVGNRVIDPVYQFRIGGMHFIGNDNQPLPGVDAPTVSDCEAANFGYRSTAWSDGWISKFPRARTVVSGHTIFVTENEISVSLFPGSFKLYDEISMECVLVSQINQVNPAWNNMDASGRKHTFSSINLYNADNPNIYLPQYIVDMLTDRCRQEQ